MGRNIPPVSWRLHDVEGEIYFTLLYFKVMQKGNFAALMSGSIHTYWWMYGKRPTETPRLKLDVNIKMDLK
jgi:hypothetical protein